MLTESTERDEVRAKREVEERASWGKAARPREVVAELGGTEQGTRLTGSREVLEERANGRRRGEQSTLEAHAARGERRGGSLLRGYGHREAQRSSS